MNIKSLSIHVFVLALGIVIGFGVSTMIHNLPKKGNPTSLQDQQLKTANVTMIDPVLALPNLKGFGSAVKISGFNGKMPVFEWRGNPVKVNITASTKISSLVSMKKPEIYQKEMADFEKNIYPGIKNDKSKIDALAPKPFDVASATISDIHVGSAVLIKPSKLNLDGITEIPATEIIILKDFPSGN